jgi:hypothetical protein
MYKERKRKDRDAEEERKVLDELAALARDPQVTTRLGESAN